MLVHDPDTAHGDVTHWLVWDIPGARRTIGEDESRRLTAVSGRNERGEIAYLPPTPPKGDAPHHYIFELFALDVPHLEVARGSSRESLENALSDHALGVAQLTGMFGRS